MIDENVCILVKDAESQTLFYGAVCRLKDVEQLQSKKVIDCHYDLGGCCFDVTILKEPYINDFLEDLRIEQQEQM